MERDVVPLDRRDAQGEPKGAPPRRELQPSDAFVLVDLQRDFLPGGSLRTKSSTGLRTVNQAAGAPP